MSRSIIAPIIAVIILALNSAFDLSITDSEKEIIIDGAVSVGLLIVTIIGIIKDHKKKVNKDV